MAKATKIPKIPKGLSDKDMLQGYVEETSIETQFMQAEANDDKIRRAKALGKKSNAAALAGLPDDLVAKLDKELLKLQMEMFNSGNKKYTLQVKREGNNIVIYPKING